MKNSEIQKNPFIIQYSCNRHLWENVNKMPKTLIEKDADDRPQGIDFRDTKKSESRQAEIDDTYSKIILNIKINERDEKGLNRLILF